MADPIQTFDLGRTLQAAEAIKGMRRDEQTDSLRNAYLNTQIAGAQQAQQIQGQSAAAEQQALAAKRQYYTAQAALSSTDPKGTIEAIAPQFVQDFETKHGQGSWQQLTPQQAHQAAQSIMQQAQSVIGPQAKVKYVDQGGQLQAIDENTGQPIEGLAPMAKSASPDSVLSSGTSTANAKLAADTSRANNAATVAATQRGQNMTADTAAAKLDAAGPGGLGSREGVMFQRVMNSANSAATALKNIAELPVGSSTGLLGIGSSPGHSLYESTKSALLNKVASQDVQSYNTMLAGVSRNLSTIETAGLAPNGSITASMDSIQLRENDTELTKLRKLAEMRQIIEKGIEPNLANPKLPQAQKDLVRGIVKQVSEAIPFTQHDLTDLAKRQQTNPAFTLQDLIKKQGLRPDAPAQGNAAQGNVVDFGSLPP